MANERSSQVATPGFDPQASVSGSLPGVPTPTDPAAAVAERVADQVGAMAGGFADQQAQKEGQQAGAVAGLDPNWRPQQDPTLRGQAFDAAAQSTYVNNLQTQTRQSIANAYDKYQQLPVDQQDPVAFAKQLQDMRGQIEQAHVFPQILPSFRKQFDDMAFTYAQKASSDNDTQVKDAAKASFLANQQSASDTAMRAASLVTPEGDALAQKEADAHDKLVDQQVQDGTITAVAAQKAKSDFRDALSQTAIMAKFNSLDPAGQASFLDTFRKSYGTGTGTPNADGTPIGADAQGLASRRAMALSYFQSQGWTPAQAAGIVGNLDWESGGLNPKALAKGDGSDGSDSIGLGQWNGARAQALKAFAAAHGKDPGDFATQLAFAQQELSGASGNALRSAGDVAAATAAVVLGFERPAGSETGDPTRTAGWSQRLARANAAIGANPSAGLSDSAFTTLSGQMASTILRNQHAANALGSQSVSEIDGVQKIIEAGDDVPPATWNALQTQYSSSADPKVQAALAQATAVRAALAGFKGQSPQAIEAAIANDQGAQVQTGTTPQQLAVTKAEQSYLTKYRADLDADPVGRAAKEGVIGPVTPIDFTNPQSAVAGLQARVPQAQAAARFFNRGDTLLMPAEQAQLKQLARQGGAPMVAAARAAVQALGPDAGTLFNEVGGEAPAFAAAGRVAAVGGAPGFVDDLARAQAISQDPSARKALELPSESNADAVLNNQIGAGLANAPAMNAQVRQAARQVYAVRALDQNLDRKAVDADTMTRAANEAAGGSYDGATQYGGFTSYKPPGFWRSQTAPIVAPPAMQADGVPQAVKALTDADLTALPKPPVAGDGKTPLPASALQSGYLSTVGHGVYWVSRNDPSGADPQWAMAPDGTRFRLDLNALEPVLRARLPGLYRSR